MTIDYNNTDLDQYATTDIQRETLALLREHGNQSEAARKAGKSRESIKQSWAAIKKRYLARQSDIHDASANPIIPEGYHVKGASSAVRNSDGLITWIKTDIDKQKQWELMSDAVDRLLEQLPQKTITPTPVLGDAYNEKLLNQYTITDFHIGMLAWYKEGGDNWDLDIAEKTLKQCFIDMIHRSPRTNECIIAQLGDWFHYDSMNSETPTSHHLLDSDCRPEKMIDMGLDCMEFLIDTALQYHETVNIASMQGNHDLYSSMFMRKHIERLYKNEPRVNVLKTSTPFLAFEWGDQMLGYHHGHKVKMAALPQVFMDEYRDMYGRTKYTAIHLGHFHHQEMKEIGSTVVEMHRTLAARDSHASYGGYHSQRAADVITYHKDFGEYERKTVRPMMVGNCK